MITFTFAKWRRAVPLRGMAGDTADNDLTDKFVTLITEETQSFSCLVAVLVQGLVTIVRDTRVWAWVIFYCSEHKKRKKKKKKERGTVMYLKLICSNKSHKQTDKSSRVQEGDLQTHFGLRSLHLGVPVSRPWQEIWLGPSS